MTRSGRAAELLQYAHRVSVDYNTRLLDQGFKRMLARHPSVQAANRHVRTLRFKELLRSRIWGDRKRYKDAGYNVKQ